MSFNAKLRKAVYGDARSAQVNPLLGMPAGVTGMTWQGTGFEQGPPEPVALDQAALPWELQPESFEQVHTVPPAESKPDLRTTLRYAAGVALLLGIIVTALIVVGA